MDCSRDCTWIEQRRCLVENTTGSDKNQGEFEAVSVFGVFLGKKTKRNAINVEQVLTSLVHRYSYIKKKKIGIYKQLTGTRVQLVGSLKIHLKRKSTTSLCLKHQTHYCSKAN